MSHALAESIRSDTRYLFSRVGRQWRRRLLGQRPDVALQAGVEASDQADYSIGDDLKYVDWNRCARHDELVSKRFPGSELQELHLWCDASASMGVGAGKWDFARRVVGALGQLAIRSGESVWMGAFAQSSLRPGGPWRGPSSEPAVAGELDGWTTADEPGDFRTMARWVTERHPAGRTLIVISDLFHSRDSHFDEAVRRLRRHRCNVLLIQVFGPDEADPSLLGNFQLRDPESGSGVGAVLSREDLAHYRDVFDEYCAGMRRLCRRASVGLLQTSSASRPAEAIARLTRLHQSFRRGGA